MSATTREVIRRAEEQRQRQQRGNSAILYAPVREPVRAPVWAETVASSTGSVFGILVVCILFGIGGVLTLVNTEHNIQGAILVGVGSLLALCVLFFYTRARSIVNS